MQFLSAGKRSLREKTHARDAGLQTRNRGLATRFGLVDPLHGEAHALLVPKGQLTCGLEDAAGVNGINRLDHSLLLSQSYGELDADATTAASGDDSRAGPNVARLREALLQRAEVWRAMLRGEPKVARVQVRRLIGPLTLRDESQRPEWVKGEAPAKPALLDGLVQDMASQIYVSWNRMAGWLRAVDGLRRVA